MATRAAAWRGRDLDRAFFTGVALVLLAGTVAGFAPTYYLRGLSELPPLSPLVIIHGAANSAWILLFVAQTSLIAAGRPDLHRLTGVAGATLGTVIVVLALVTAVVAGRLHHGPPGTEPRSFLAFPIITIAVFAAFLAAGVARRRKAEAHKRLMLLATLTLAVPALARLSKHAQLPFLPGGPIGGMILSDVVLAALCAFDMVTRGKLHRVTLWGGALLLASEPLRFAVGRSGAWQSFARALIG